MRTEAAETRIPSLKGIKMTPEFIAKFEGLIDRNGPTQPHTPELGPCWLWKGSLSPLVRKSKNPYGRIYLHPYEVKAHRASYAIYNGDVPDDLLCRHRCDFETCVNPAHLELGTHADNANDRATRGRGCCGDRHPFRVNPGKAASICGGDKHWTRKRPQDVLRGDNHPWRKNPELVRKGVRHGMARLTEAQVMMILNQAADNVMSRKEIAAQFPTLTPATIWHVINRRTWTHLDFNRPIPALGRKRRS